MATSTSELLIRLSALAVVIAASFFFSPASSLSGPPPLGKRYRVGGPDGWRVPPPEEKEMYYIKWASPITFFVEDSIGNALAALNFSTFCFEDPKLNHLCRGCECMQSSCTATTR